MKELDINVKDSRSQTHFQLTENQKRPEIAELLRKHGAKEDKASQKNPK